MDTRGLVLEIQGDKIVVLTSTGEFKECKYKNQNINIGDEITVPTGNFQRFIKSQSWLVTAAAAVFLILIIPFLIKSNATAGQTVAYLSVDINPSLEISLNKDLKVIKTKTLNSDANLIIKKINLSGLSAPDAIAKITDLAYENGFISQSKDNAIVLAVTPANNSFNPVNFENSLKDATQEVLTKDKIDAIVQTISTSPTIRKEAASEGLSTGKYALLLEAVDSGLNIKTSDLKKESISMAIKNAGGNINDIVTKVHNEKQLERLTENYKGKMKSSKDNKDDLKLKEDEDIKKSNDKKSIDSKNKGKSNNSKENEQSDTKEYGNNKKIPPINNAVPPKAPVRPVVEEREQENND